jgi:hypothetical protein
VDYRCPNCGRDLATRKLALAVIVKMETDCPGCLQRLTMNIHAAESASTLLFSGGFVGLVLAGVAFERNALVGAGVVVGLAGGLAGYLIERVWLRAWPRYRSKDASGPA